MSKSSPSLARNVHTAERGARHAATGQWMTLLARYYYAAKGVVYLIIGIIAVQVAIGARGAVTDQKGGASDYSRTAIRTPVARCALPQITSAFATISHRLDATPGSPLQPVHIGLFSPW
jgi:hypothetical protein